MKRWRILYDNDLIQQSKVVPTWYVFGNNVTRGQMQKP